MDGQQRLTTLYIILQHLVATKFKKLLSCSCLECYHLYYATKPGLHGMLENISSTPCTNGSIDAWYIGRAWEAVREWVEGEKGKGVSRYTVGRNRNIDEVLEMLYRLLIPATDDNPKTIKFIWYELLDPDVVGEKAFRAINSGRIPLMGVELIKALFLMKRNFKGAVMAQERIALEWERIEDRLGDDAFWGFLARFKEATELEHTNRMEVLFALLDPNKEEGATRKETRGLRYFTQYYDLFAQYDAQQNLDKVVKGEWGKIMGVFWVLDDWFSKPILHNYIGLLARLDPNATLQSLHESWSTKQSASEFRDFLRDRIQEHLKLTEEIFDTLDYEESRKETIRKVLLTFNVELLSQEPEEGKNPGSIASHFPFAQFEAEAHDIEHVDSQTGKELEDMSKDELEKLWAIYCEAGFINKITPEETPAREFIIEQISQLQAYYKEGAKEEDGMHGIGNLALLRLRINRGYGNAIFPLKRMRIIEAMEKGVYIPRGTELVFLKLYNKKGDTMLDRWTGEDADSYKAYMKLVVAKFFTEK